MTKETVIIIDNSEYCRNTDLLPTRLMSSKNAASTIVNAFCRGEDSVAVVGTAPATCLSPLSRNQASLLNTVNSLQTGPSYSIINALRIGHLLLKRKPDESYKGKLVMFIGSPLDGQPEEYFEIARALKKLEVEVCVVTYGERDQIDRTISEFCNVVSSSNYPSCFVPVSQGGDIDTAVTQSAFVGGPEAVYNEFEDDPELAAAIALSMQTYQADQNL